MRWAMIDSKNEINPSRTHRGHELEIKTSTAYQPVDSSIFGNTLDLGQVFVHKCSDLFERLRCSLVTGVLFFRVCQNRGVVRLVLHCWISMNMNRCSYLPCISIRDKPGQSSWHHWPMELRCCCQFSSKWVSI
jgi:hypothetical protein